MVKDGVVGLVVAQARQVIEEGILGQGLTVGPQKDIVEGKDRRLCIHLCFILNTSLAHCNLAVLIHAHHLGGGIDDVVALQCLTGSDTLEIE